MIAVLGRRPSWPNPRQANLILFALSLTGTIWAVGIFVLAGGGPGFDTFAYWRSTQVADPYTVLNGFGAFQYTPAARLLFAPLGLIPWPAVYWPWLALSFGLVAWMCRRRTLAVLIFIPLVMELFEGNTHVLIAAAIVASFRWPAAWSIVLLTKVSPGIGLLWYVVRREWRNLAIALAATAVLLALSVVLFGIGSWQQWAQHVLTNPTQGQPLNLIDIPVLRPPAAVALVVWGARTDRRWTVPIAAMLALPLLWFYSLSMLVAVIPLGPARPASGKGLVAAWEPRSRNAANSSHV